MVLTLPYSNAARAKNRIPLPELTYPHPFIRLWIYNWLFLRGAQGVRDEPVRALGALGGALPEPGGGDHRAADGGADDPQQHVQPLHAGVAPAGALFGVAERGLDGVVDVDVAELVRTGQQRRGRAQVGQQPGGDRVELPDVPEREGP